MSFRTGNTVKAIKAPQNRGASKAEAVWLSENKDPAAEFGKRDQYIVGSIRFCEVCNQILREGTQEYFDHYGPLKYHQPKWLLIVRCGRCGDVVLDTASVYGIERNQFWCKKCIEQEGYGIFRSTQPVRVVSQGSSKIT